MTPPVLNNDKRLFKLGGVIHFGGLEGDRTLDLCDANAALSQLSYEPILAIFHRKKLRKMNFQDIRF